MITNRIVLMRLFAACMISLAGLSPAAHAATYTWDADGGTTGPQDGAGTWNTTLQNWWNGTTNIAWPDPNTADIARFGAGSGAAGTVTVGAVQANGLTFAAAGSGNYTLSSGTITLGGSLPTITTSANATIQSSLAGSGFTKSGASTLTLSGALANTFTGTTTVTAGRLQLGKSNGIQAIGGDLVINAGDVRFQGTNQLAATASIQVNGGAGIPDVGNNFGQSLANVTHASTGVSNLSAWTLSGTLAVSTGTAEVNSLATSTFNTMNLSGGRLLLYAGSGATTVNVGGGGLTLTGGTVRLGNSNTAFVAKLSLGGDFRSNGQGVFEVGNATTSPQIELTGGQRTFTISGGTTTVVAGIAVTGTGGLTKAGAGLLVLNGSNTFSGDTLVSAGTLQLGNSLALQNSPLDTSGGGVVTLSGPTTLTLGGLKGSTALASAIASGYSGLTSLTLNVASGTSVTYAGAIADGVAGMTLTKLGSGTQVLSGTNTYSGGTVVSAGSLVGTTASLRGGITNNANVTFDQGTTGTYSGAMGGTGSLAKTGADTLTLSGSNSYTGGTQINAGVLALGGTDALGSTGTISFGGGTLQFSSANTTDYSSRFSTGTNQAIRLDTNSQNVTLATALSGSGSSLTKLGSGTLTLSGSNSYTGGTQLNAGTLVFGTTSALGTGTVTLAGGVLQSGTGGTLTNAFTITATSGTFDSQGNSNSLSGVIRGTGGLVKLGSGTLTLSGAAANTYSGTTTLEAGALSLSKSANVVAVPGDLVVNGGNVVLGAVGQFASTANLFVNNAGTVNAAEVSNAQTVANVTYNSTAMSGLSNWTVTGTLAVASGQITFNTNQSGSFSAIRMTGGSLMPYANGFPTTINVGTGGLSMTNALIQYGTSAYNGAGTGKVVLGGDFTGSGTNRLYKGNTNQISQLDLGSITRTFTITDGTTTVDTGVSVIGTGGLTKAGGGLLVLNGNSTFSGDTLVSSGTLRIGNGLALQNSVLDTAGGGLIALSGPTTLTLGGLKGSTALASEIPSGYSSVTAVTLNVSSGTAVAYAGNIANGAAGMSLTKTGSGTQALSGANSYTGATQVSAGVLEFTSIADSGTSNVSALGAPTSGNATISLANDATLRYTGTGGHTSNRTINLATASTGTATLDASGSGGVTLNGSITAASGSKTLLLTGPSVADNTLGLISDASSSATSLVKQGAGRWVLNGASTFTGPTTIEQGELVLGVDSGQTSGSLGAGNAVITIGTPTGSGTAALLLKAGVKVTYRDFVVPEGGAQMTIIGSADGSGTATFQAGTKQITLGRDVTLVAKTNGTMEFNNVWAFSGGTAKTITVGSPGNAGTVVLGDLLGTTGTIRVEAGTLRLGTNGAISSASNIVVGPTGAAAAIFDVRDKASFAVGSAQTLSGTGTLLLDADTPVSVAGFFSPGNSPGIFTFVGDGSGGMITLAGTTSMEIAGTTVGTSYDQVKFTSGATLNYGSGSLLLDISGTYADNTSFKLFDFASTASGSFTTISGSGSYGLLSFVRGTSGVWTSGSTSQPNQTFTFTESTGTLVVVPEPATLALAAIGIGLGGWAALRRRK